MNSHLLIIKTLINAGYHKHWEIQHLCLGSCPLALESVNSAHSVFKPTMSAGAQLHTGKLDLDQHVWIHEKKKPVHYTQILS